MFITREEALAKLYSPDNPFSPSRKGSSDWGRVVEVDGSSPADSSPAIGGIDDSNSSTNDPSSIPVSHDDSVPQEASAQDDHNPSADEIRNILRQVDPAVARDRTVSLKGKIAVQAAIGETAILVGPATAGALFDRSNPQTKAYENGHGHHKSRVGAEAGPPKPELTVRLNEFKEKLALAAGKVLESSLDALDVDKIKRLTKATSISRVAKDMAVIMDKVSKNDNADNAVHFHIYRPDMRSVQAYEKVTINGGANVSGLVGPLIDVLPVTGSETTDNPVGSG